MSKTICMLLDEKAGYISEVTLGQEQKIAFEKELEYSYAKEDYENLKEYHGIKIKFSNKDFLWEEKYLKT